MSDERGVRVRARRLWQATGPSLQLAPPQPWMEAALCLQTDPEVFFPEKGGTTIPAKRICGDCDVRAECLAWALDHAEAYGVWGGLSAIERRRLTRRTA